MSEVANLNKISDLEGRVIVLRGLLGRLHKYIYEHDTTCPICSSFGCSDDCDLAQEVKDG